MCSSCVYANDTNETTDINTEISNINVPSLDISHHSVNATLSVSIAVFNRETAYALA